MTDLFDDAPSAGTAMDFFPGTRDQGLARIKAFTPSMGSAYARTRNSDFGPDARHNVSCLSPFIRHRLIAEQEVIDAARSTHSFRAAEKFLQEVYWRTYFKGWLERRPHVWSLYKDAVRLAHDQLSGGMAKAYDKAIAGETGIDAFDAWAKELTEIGYLHNHARMWFASIWIFTLRLPWVLGADHFLRHLLDGDAASNTLSWRWVAGLHTRGKNYVARADNIQTYTDGRFNAEGVVLNPPPLEDDWNGRANAAPSLSLPSELKNAYLLFHEDDLGVETLPLQGHEIVGTGIIAAPDARGSAASGPQVHHFIEDALADTERRVQQKLGVAAQVFKHPSEIQTAVTASDASTVLLPYLPVGPMKDMLSPQLQDLQAQGIAVHLIQRRYDRAAWPHCDKGFFALKKCIPKLLDAAD